MTKQNVSMVKSERGKYVTLKLEFSASTCGKTPLKIGLRIPRSDDDLLEGEGEKVQTFSSAAPLQTFKHHELQTLLSSPPFCQSSTTTATGLRLTFMSQLWFCRKSRKTIHSDVNMSPRSTTSDPSSDLRVNPLFHMNTGLKVNNDRVTTGCEAGDGGGRSGGGDSTSTALSTNLAVRWATARYSPQRKHCG